VSHEQSHNRVVISSKGKVENGVPPHVSLIEISIKLKECSRNLFMALQGRY
jgi:hypothetical protein